MILHRDILFFTTFDAIEAYHPNIVVNPHILRALPAYVRRHGEPERVLVDTGVHKLFHDLNLVDYPPGYLFEYHKAIVRVSRLLGSAEIYWVVPDIPCDYPGRENLYPYNVKKTLEYVQRYLRIRDNLPGTPIAVVQGRRDDVGSVISTYRDNTHLYGEYAYLAIGPVCHTKRWALLARLILSFDHIAHAPFHCFGIHLRALEIVAHSTKKFRSFDSTAYCWLNTTSERRLIRSDDERRRSFIAYREHVERILRQNRPTLLEFVSW